MKRSFAAAAVLLLALSGSAALADNGNAPITVTPDQLVVHGRQVFISIVAVNTPVATPRRASLIIYRPDGTVIQPHRRLLRNSTAVFRVPLGALAPLGPYAVFGTVETGNQAFGMPTTFSVVE